MQTDRLTLIDLNYCTLVELEQKKKETIGAIRTLQDKERENVLYGRLNTRTKRLLEEYNHRYELIDSLMKEMNDYE